MIATWMYPGEKRTMERRMCCSMAGGGELCRNPSRVDDWNTLSKVQVADTDDCARWCDIIHHVDGAFIRMVRTLSACVSDRGG